MSEIYSLAGIFSGHGQIKTPTYKEQAYRLLKEAILYQRFQADTIYSQEAICQELGISRTPVREALLELQKENYIRFCRGKGIQIVSLDDQAIHDILEMRIYLEMAGAELAAQRAWNAQAPYGADVISRIQHTLDTPQGFSELSGRIRGQIRAMLEAALSAAGRQAEELKEISVAGNTVMESLFAGKSVAGMAAAPFRPDSLFFGPEGTGELNGVPVRLLPCVAGYVGGDITAGLMASGLGEKPGEHLFLDIGTNGEMAMGGKGGFSCCAVASGPAFEGAGIQCGMPGVDGAVSHVRYDRGFLYDVIWDGPARGLCGSGLVDLAAVLRKLEIIAPGGRLLPPEEVAPELRRYVERDGDGNGLFRLTPQV